MMSACDPSMMSIPTRTGRFVESAAKFENFHLTCTAIREPPHVIHLVTTQIPPRLKSPIRHQASRA